MNIKTVKATSPSQETEKEIQQLFDQCNLIDNTNYSFDISDEFRNEGETNLFLLYLDNMLISVISIFAPLSSEAEITAITKNDYRNQGFFKKLLSEVKSELKMRGTKSILYVCDSKSSPGLATVDSLESNYEFSEFLMEYDRENSEQNIIENVQLKNTESHELEKLKSINIAAFNMNERDAHEKMFELFTNSKRKIYSIYYKESMVGMIGVYEESERDYIHGFCIDKDFRGKGIGRAALTTLANLCAKNNRVKQIVLEVQTENENALGLYKSVGFGIDAEFRYYREKI